MDVEKLVLLLLFGFTFAEVTTEETTSTPCTTFWNRPGDCVYVTKCPTILRIVEKDNNTKEELDYLQNVNCPGPVEGYVCCDDEFDEEGIKLLNDTENFDTCGTFGDFKIIGGQEVEIHSRPWMALLMTTEGIACGGTLIRFVLTAAHCLIHDEIKVTQVRLGEHHIKEARYCKRNHICEKGHVDIDIDKTIIHNGFRRIGQYDIALIKLKNDVQYQDHIRPICLPLSQELREKGQTQNIFQVAGWGMTERNEISDVLLQAKLHRANCNTVPKAVNPKTQICAGGGLNDSCAGDSGGPLMYPNLYYGSQRFIQFGIVAYGSKQCGSGIPGVYTNVVAFLSWISKQILQ